MKSGLILLIVAGTATSAHADVFGFKDLDGYERCLQTDHLVETVKTDKGEQSRLLGPLEIQLRCIESAVKLLGPSKDKDLAMSFVKSTKRLTAPENSLDLINVLVDKSLPACNDMAVYEVINRSLSRPMSTDSKSSYSKGRGVAKRCLKDAQYRKDFLEELDSSNTQLREAACDLLLEEKLVKACPAKK
ncbi:MAG TPA: hypothetical protein VN253_29785 [Kofleriaceae bacterium]|nr:hypothetical protein [Kofleriaceae bacterium]